MRLVCKVFMSCSVQFIGDENKIFRRATTSSFTSWAANFTLNKVSYIDDCFEEHVFPLDWVKAGFLIFK